MKLAFKKCVFLTKKIIYMIGSFLWYKNGISKSINGANIRFPLAYGRYYPSDYEPYKQKFIEDYAQGLAVDLGAHIGLYTVLLSRKASKVIAFEPTTFTRKILKETLALNKCLNVVIRKEAVADASNQRIFYDTGEKVSNANSLVPIGRPLSVDTLSLDDLNLKIDFLKVDIEGAELLALRGAIKTLNFLKYMTLEIHPQLLSRLGQQVDEIFELLDPFNPIYYLEGVVVTRTSLNNKTDFFEVNIILNGAPI